MKGVWPGTFDPVRRELLRRLDERPFLGGQFYVSRDGVCLLDAAVGWACSGTPMTTDSVVYWSCAGKPLLAAAVCRLAEEKVLALTDPICQHLPAFAAGGKNGVTVEDVLSHAGGFRPFGAASPYRERFDVSLQRILAMPLEADWRPGRDQGYHQETGWYVLAALLEAKRGAHYGDVVMAEVCEPLGLRSTWTTMTTQVFRSVKDRLAVPSYVGRGGIQRVPYLVSAAACAARVPSFGYYGTMSDLAHFYEQVLAGLAGHGSSPLSPDLAHSMVGSVRGSTFDRTWNNDCDYGRGVFRDLGRHWGFAGRWSASSFGLGGLVGHVVAGADPTTGVIVAASFGALASSGDETGAIVDELYQCALDASHHRARTRT